MQHPLYDESLDKLAISVFDIETTGLFSSHNRIIQIAVVPIDNGKITDDGWVQLVHPGDSHLPLKQIIVDLTGITDDRLNGQPSMDEVIQQFDALVGTRIVAGHNIKAFDLNFMRKAEQRHGIDVQTDYYIDTLILMRKLHPELESHKLKDCGEFYDIDFDEARLHDALEDTKLTAKVLIAQINELKDKDVDTFEDMIRFLS